MARYDIDPQLASLARMKGPFNRLTIAASILVQGRLLDRERSDDAMRVTRVDIPARDGATVPALLYEPATRFSRGCLLYLHGGAFAMKGAAYHYRRARAYAERAGCSVLYADYRLAPRYPFPTPLYDCLNALIWLLERASDLGIDPAHVAVGGDSAGGALAASLCFVARDELGFVPCAQMLAYPVTDRAAEGESMQRFTDVPMFNARQVPAMWRFYLGREGRRSSEAERLLAEHPEYAAPMDVSDARLVGLPPTYVETCEFDCLHDEALAYAGRLAGAGVSVEVNETHGTVHGYDFVFDCALTHDAIERRVTFLRAAMGA